MRDGVGAFAGRALLWLAPAYAAWYFGGFAWSWASGWLARLLLFAIQPWLISGMEVSGHVITLATTAELRLQGGGAGYFLAEVDSGVYTHGLALFAALMLARRCRMRAILLGALALLPLQGIGVAFDLLSQLVRLGPAALSGAGLAAWWREPIAFGYQLGSLILPSLAPVALWAWFNRDFLAALAPRREGT